MMTGIPPGIDILLETYLAKVDFEGRERVEFELGRIGRQRSNTC